MTSYMRSEQRQEFPDASYNPNIGTVTFVLTLPVEIGESLRYGMKKSPVKLLLCLKRSIDGTTNPHTKAALQTLFDWIWERSTPLELACLPNWFDSQ